MKIKKFTATTLQEGKTRILRELGEDAIILSSRTTRKPGDSTPLIEIVAAVDDTVRNKAPERKFVPRVPDEDRPEPAANRMELLDGTSQLFNEIGALKDMIAEVSESVRYRYSNALGPVLKKIYKSLILSDFSEAYSLGVTGKLSADKPNAELSEALDYARQLITANLSVLPKLTPKGPASTFTFVGTTGCGKTTTVVKLALVLKLVFGSDVLLVSADTDKVGGADQLRTYASIASIPFQAVYSPDELKTLWEKELSRDYILIDTTGRNQKNKAELSGIHDILRAVNSDLLFLVLSCTHTSTNIFQTIKAFEFMKPDALILSKIDEAVSLGHVVEAVGKFRIPIGYVTNGQKIPDDIEPANLDSLSKIVLPDSIVLDGK